MPACRWRSAPSSPGLLLAETEYRRAVEAMIDPFRGLLLGVFFFSVGMHIDLGFIWREPLLVAAAFVAMIVAKTVLLAPLCRLFGVPWAASVETSLLLAAGGEFAFIGIGLSVQLGLVKGDAAAGVLAVVSLTMAGLPFIALFARRAGHHFEKAVPSSPVFTVLPPDDHAKRVLVVGHGRVGQLVCDLLDKHQIAYIAADRDPAQVERWRNLGRPVYYGDASNPLFLKRCGIDEALGVIVTIDTAAVDDVVRAVRSPPAGRDDRGARPRRPACAPSLYAAASPTRCPRPSRRACNLPNRRWSGSACRWAW